MSFYIAGVSYDTVSDAMIKLAPTCEECQEPKTHICLERCCTQHVLFCFACDSKCHLTHRTNKLELLFFPKAGVLNPDKEAQDLFSNLLASIQKAKEISNAIIAHNLQLVESYEKNIKEVSLLLESCKQNTWYENLYETVETYIKGKSTLKESKRLFRDGMSKVRREKPLAYNQPSIS